MKNYLLVGIIVLFIIACNEKRNQNLNAIDTFSEKEKESLLVSNKEKTSFESFPPDSFYLLLSGKFDFNDSLLNSLPDNSSNYFSSIEFPYYYPKALSLDYSCRHIPFKITDFYIFNKKNNISACEYIALIDTTDCPKIILRQCVDMENWVILYTMSKDYRVIDYALLMTVGGEVDDVALKFDNKTVIYDDYIDSLKYYNGVFWVSRSDMYAITKESGNIISEIGFQKIKTLITRPNGTIVSSDSVSIRKEYIDKYEKLNSYRF